MLVSGGERLFQLFRARTRAPPPAFLDGLPNGSGCRDRQILWFLVHVLEDREQATELRLEVVKALRTVPLAADDHSIVAQAIEAAVSRQQYSGSDRTRACK